jgi:hypothetical protein
MNPTVMSILKYAATGIIVVALGALAGWYFYLRQQGVTLTDVTRGRGLSTVVPSFNAPGGNTLDNIAAGLSNAADKVASLVQGDTQQPSGKLWHIDRTPIAGVGFETTAGTSSARIIYAQQATGHIFTADPATQMAERISNVLVPKTYRALFARDGSFVMQTVGEDGFIHSVAGARPEPTQEGDDTSTSTPTLGRELPRNMRALALDPVRKTLLWVAADNGGLAIMSSAWSASGTRLLATPVGSWRLFASAGTSYAVLGGDESAPGYAYRIAKAGALSPLVKNIPGLSFLPSENPAVFLYSSALGTAPTLYVKTTASSSPIALTVHTIADKCVWAPGKAQIAYCAVPAETAGFSLAGWYRGQAHTVDSWWEIDAANGTAKEVYAMQRAEGGSLDVRQPVIDPSGNVIAFINGVDQSLWLWRIH